MRKYSKKLATVLAPVLAVSMLAPTAAFANVAAAADAGNSSIVAQVVYGSEELAIGTDNAKKIYVDVMKKDGTTPASSEVYKVSELANSTVNEIDKGTEKSIDISTLTAKGGVLQVYSDKDNTNKIKITLNAQDKLKKAEDNNGALKVTKKDGSEATGTFEYRKGNTEWKNADALSLNQFYAKGATLYVRTKAVNSTASAIKIEDGAPASKEVKLKIKAQAKGPKVTLDPVKNTVKFPSKDVEIMLSVANGAEDPSISTWAAIQAANKKDLTKTLESVMVVSGKALTITNAAIGSVSNAAVFEVRTHKEGKTPSKISEVVIPWQKYITSEQAISSSAGFSFDYALNSSKTKATGIKVSNATSAAMEFKVVSDITKISEDTSKWTKIAAGKSKVVSSKKAAEGSYVVYRFAGVKANAKKNIEFAWASNAVVDQGNAIAYPAAPKNDLAVSLGTNSNTAVSGVSIKVTTESGIKYYYNVDSKEVKSCKIGEAQPSGATEITNGVVASVECKKGNFITVYAVKDNVVVKFASKKAETLS